MGWFERGNEREGRGAPVAARGWNSHTCTNISCMCVENIEPTFSSAIPPNIAPWATLPPIHRRKKEGINSFVGFMLVIRETLYNTLTSSHWPCIKFTPGKRKALRRKINPYTFKRACEKGGGNSEMWESRHVFLILFPFTGLLVFTSCIYIYISVSRIFLSSFHEVFI